MNNSMKDVKGRLSAVHMEIHDMQKWHSADSIINLEGSFQKAEQLMEELKRAVQFAKSKEVVSRTMDIETKTMMIRLLILGANVSMHSTGTYAGEAVDLFRMMRARLEGRGSSEAEVCLRDFLMKEWGDKEVEEA